MNTNTNPEPHVRFIYVNKRTGREISAYYQPAEQVGQMTYHEGYSWYALKDGKHFGPTRWSTVANFKKNFTLKGE